jgi:UDP-glucuronate 4-epimerase
VFNNPPGEAEPHRLYNIGNNQSEYVTDLVRLLEQTLGREAQTINAPKPEADPVKTWADISALNALCGYTPTTPLCSGIPRFVEWYLHWRQLRDTL